MLKEVTCGQEKPEGQGEFGTKKGQTTGQALGKRRCELGRFDYMEEVVGAA